MENVEHQLINDKPLKQHQGRWGARRDGARTIHERRLLIYEETRTSTAVRGVALFDHMESEKVLHEQPKPAIGLLI